MICSMHAGLFHLVPSIERDPLHGKSHALEKAYFSVASTLV
jgi:hypothetical protein